MKRVVLVASVCLLTFPALAVGKPVTPAHARQYLRDYQKVVREFGQREPGRQILLRGLAGGRRATDADVVRSIGVLERDLTPITAVFTAVPATARSSAAATPATPGGQYAIPTSIVMCESGGNWRAVNPTSGAGGAYQILPSTWSSYGGQGLPQNASPAEQSRVAAAIWAQAGPTAWVC